MRVLAAIVLASLPALASEPGEPFDCSDWVFLDSEYSCSASIPYPCHDKNGELRVWCRNLASVNADSEGRLVGTHQVVAPTSCGEIARRIEIRILDGSDDRVIAYLDNRCADGFAQNVFSSGLVFDQKNGRLFVQVDMTCTPNCANEPTRGSALFEILGFGRREDPFPLGTPDEDDEDSEDRD